VAGGCQVCNTGVLRLGDDVRVALEELDLEGGDVLAAALKVADKFCAAMTTKRTTWASCL